MRRITFKNGFPLFLALVALGLGGCDKDRTNTAQNTIEEGSQSSLLGANSEQSGMSDDAGEARPADGHSEFITLKQGWNRDEAMDFYNTSQGSQLMPYSWFLALEQPGSESLFLDDANIRQLGYIPQQKTSGINPDGLPIGFVKDDNPEDFLPCDQCDYL